jgi:transposase
MSSPLPSPLEKRDARKLSREALQEQRSQIIALFKEGMPVMQIVQQCGLSWTAVNTAIKRYKAGGSEALLPDQRGRKEGSGRLLTEMQEQTICQYIASRRPWFYGLKDTLWSADTVSQLIERKLTIKLSERSIANYLKRWGLMKGTIKKKPFDRCTNNVRIWLEIHYESILEKSNQENSEIYWLNSPNKIHAKIWTASKNPDFQVNTPEIENKKKSVISITSSQGKIYFVVLSGSFTSEKQINILKNILKNKSKKIYLIRCNEKTMANSDCHHWVRNTDSIELLPDLNFI